MVLSINARYTALKFLVVHIEPSSRISVLYLAFGVVGFFLRLLCPKNRHPAHR